MPYIDPTGRGRAATIALAVYMVAELVQVLAAIGGLGNPVKGGATLAVSVSLIAAVLATGMWTYRVNANAHTFANGLSSTPGWAVGWYFVPIANLWKPFEAMRETWAASTEASDWAAMPVPTLLRVWWGCWLVGNFVSNGALRFGGDPSLASTFELVSSALLIAAGAAMVRIITLLDRMQPRAHAAITFA